MNPKRLASIISAQSTLLLLGYGLLVSSIIQAKTVQLTYYHALVLLNLSWLIAITSLNTVWSFLALHPGGLFKTGKEEKRKVPPNLRRTLVTSTTSASLPGLTFDHPRFGVEKEFEESPKKMALQASIYSTFFLTLMSAIALWIFHSPSEIDILTPGCSSQTLYYFYNRAVRADSKAFQIVSLAIYSVAIVPILNIFILHMIQIPWFFFIARCVCYYLFDALKRINPSIKRYLDEGMYGFFIPMLTISSFLMSFFIVSTEEMIRNNHVLPGEDQWTFGQTLSMFLLIPGIQDLWAQAGETREVLKQRKRPDEMVLQPLGIAISPNLTESDARPEA